LGRWRLKSANSSVRSTCARSHGWHAPALAWLWIALWTAAATVPARADQVTLQRALDLMRRHNPELSAVRQELTVARGELQKASYLTPFNFELASEADYKARSTRSNSQDWRVGFIQEFEIFGQRALRQKSARIGYDTAITQLSDQTRLLQGATKLTFYEAMRVRDELALLAELARLDFNLVQAARTRLDAGEINQVEYNSAQIRYGQSHRALLQGRERYRLLRSSLGRLLGGQAGAEPEPAGGTRLKPIQIEIESLLEGARRTRPDLRSRQFAIAQLDTEITLNRRRNSPNPAIGMFFGHDNNTERFIGPLLGFSVPLFNRRVGEETILSGRRAQAKDQLRATELNVEQQVRDAYNNYLTARQSLRIYEDEVEVPARQSFGLLETAFTEGKIDLLRLSIAEREAFEARMAYVDAWFDVLAAQVAIELATGTTLQTASP
jgi:outer membrane protein, heavy metal efflux system